jgi:hypothetical protein
MSDKFQARKLSGQLPLDFDLVAVSAAIPVLRLAAQRGDIPNPSSSKALTTEDANLNFSLVEQREWSIGPRGEQVFA